MNLSKNEISIILDWKRVVEEEYGVCFSEDEKELIKRLENKL